MNKKNLRDKIPATAATCRVTYRRLSWSVSSTCYILFSSLVCVSCLISVHAFSGTNQPPQYSKRRAILVFLFQKVCFFFFPSSELRYYSTCWSTYTALSAALWPVSSSTSYNPFRVNSTGTFYYLKKIWTPLIEFILILFYFIVVYVPTDLFYISKISFWRNRLGQFFRRVFRH